MSETSWRVVCECGYVVEGLTEMQARRFSAHHEDDEHEPEYVEVVSFVSAPDEVAW